MASSREVKVAILGDADSLSRAFKKAGDDSDAFTKSLDATGKKMQDWGKKISVAVGVPLALAFHAGFAELTESQKVLAQTDAALKSTGGAAGVTAKQIDGMASSLSHLSGIDDEAIASGENLLLTFTKVRNEAGKNNDIFNQATRAALDMSVALGTDMSSAAILVGKALNDPIAGLTALRRVGVSFTAQQREQIAAMVDAGDTMGAQKLILQELTTEFGGSAKAFGDTLPGQLAKARNAVDEMSASLLMVAAPAILAVANALQHFALWVQNAPEPIKILITALAGLAAIGGPVLYVLGSIARTVAAFREAFPNATIAIQHLTTGMEAVAAASVAWVGVAALAVGAAVGLHEAFTNANGDLTIYTHSLTKLTDAQLKHASAVLLAEGDYDEFRDAVRRLADESESTARKLVTGADLTAKQKMELLKVIDQEVAANERSAAAANGAMEAADGQNESTLTLTESIKALNDYVNAQADAELTLEGASISMDSAIKNANETIKQHGADTLEARQAVLQGKEAIERWGQAVFDNAALAGKSTKDATNEQIWALAGVANTLEPGSPLRVWLEQYIARLQTVPTDIETQFRARLDNALMNVINSGNPIFIPPPPGTPGYSGAKGAIVTRATVATIGEAGPEVVVPLDKAPGAAPIQNLGAGTAPIVVQLVLDRRVIAEAVASELNLPGGPKVTQRAIVG